MAFLNVPFLVNRFYVDFLELLTLCFTLRCSAFSIADSHFSLLFSISLSLSLNALPFCIALVRAVCDFNFSRIFPHCSPHCRRFIKKVFLYSFRYINAENLISAK